MRRRYIFHLLPFILIVFLSLPACEEEKVEPEEDNDNNEQNDNENQLNESFYELMNHWYLWYEEIPDIDPQNYENPQAILDEIRYEEDDWSYITTYEAFQQYYEEGAYYGYGFGYKWDSSDSLRITFVFEDSPFKEFDIERSWVITKVNGNSLSPSDNLGNLLGANEAGVENEFEFKSPDGETFSETFAKEEISMNTVLMDTVIDYNDTNVGYFVLKSFIDQTPGELTETFRKFSDQNIDELVIDLRYNGGGTLSASRFLGEFIIDDDAVNQTFVKISHNDKRSQNDTTHVFGEDSLGITLGLSRVYFITTQATASASEAVINGLEPYFDDVYLVGQDTYGKPVGMYAFTDSNDEYAFLPVCFALENANGVADYYDGLPADMQTQDDIWQPFGSLDEDCLYQTLYHIRNGSFDQRKAGYQPIPENKVEYRSLRDEIGAL